MKNNKGFTLVELLAVIVILAVILLIAVPNVFGIIDKSRSDTLVSNAKMMASAARLKVTTTPSYLPSANLKVKSILLTDLDLEKMDRDPDGGSYGANSYVYVARDDTGVLHYYVTLQGSKRAINKIEGKVLSNAVVGNSDTAEAVVTVGTVSLDGVVYTVE
jgi:type IV pilus assembly protein PilA